MSGSTKLTSKNQVTIPAKLIKEAGIRKGERFAVSLKNGQLVLTPMLKLVDDLAGSVKVPHDLRGLDVTEIRKRAAHEYFSNRG